MEGAVCPVTIGRTSELGRLRDAISQLGGRQARFVLITGEAGIGKTRLAHEAATAAGELGLPVLWGSCAVADLSLPYLPYVEAVGNQLTLTGTAALATRLGGARRELAALFPQLDSDAAPAAPDPSDTGQSRLRLYEAMVALLRELAGERGLLLVIDDLQWADAATMELLDYQLRRLQSIPAIVVATCRVEELSRQHPVNRLLERWRRLPTTICLDLEGLEPNEVAGMVREIAGGERVGADLTRLLQERCAGNPYAVEEMLKTTLDRRAPGEPLRTDGLKLPRSVRDTLLLRLERLPAPAVELVRAASVLRSPFDHRTLAVVLGWPDAEVQDALRTAVEEQFLEEDPTSYAEYRFRHQLTRDAVYEDMVAPQREAFHVRAAEALGDDRSTPAVDLAHHMLAAHRWEAAVPLALEAAEAANRTHAYADAARLYEKVLPLVSDPETGARVRCELGTSLLLAGDTARGQEHLETGVAMLDGAGAAPAAAHYRLALGRCLWERGDVAGARRAYERVRDELAPSGPSADLALAYVRLAGLASFGLDGPETVRLAGEAERIAAESGAEAPRIWAYNFHGLGLVQLGQVDEGLEFLDRSYREARAQGLNVVAANALYNSVIVLNQHFRPREALERLRPLEAMQAGSMASLQALRAEGMIRLWGTGEPELARSIYEEALALARSGDQSHFVNWLQTQLAAVWVQLDDPRRAAELLPPEGAQVEGQDRVVESWARIAIELNSGRLPEAAARARQAIGGTGWPLRVRLSLADLAVEAFAAAGDADDTRRALAWCREADAVDAHPSMQRMAGRLALLEGDAVGAAAMFARSVAAWAAAGARHQEAWTRLALADALMRSGEVAAAQAELRTGLASARERSARLEARLFSERLEARRPTLPLEVVQDALEHLDNPTSEALGKLRSASGVGTSVTELRDELRAAVERAAALADPRDAEAGRVLRDYYLRRVGSHEVVAERLHLSRTTFYRRLHRGWELVAADLLKAR